MPIIETERLRKTFRRVVRGEGLAGAVVSLFARRYHEVVAVDDVTMAVDAGEVVGYLGPNGAGKSTTIKMLTGILVPTSGRIAVAGIVPHVHRTANARNIGVVFGQRSQLYWDRPLRESFRLLRAIYSIPPDTFRRNVDRFAQILDLGRFMDTPVRQLSLGERMRGDFAAALLHDPPIVFLDEPTIGLDVVAKEAIRTFILEMNRERGTTVILTTHDLADVERVCRRIVLIDEGTVIYDGSVGRLRDEYGTTRTLVFTLAETPETFAIPGGEVELRDGGLVRLRFDRRRESAESLIRYALDHYAVTDISIIEPEIDDIVRRIYLEGYTRPSALHPG